MHRCRRYSHRRRGRRASRRPGIGEQLGHPRWPDPAHRRGRVVDQSSTSCWRPRCRASVAGRRSPASPTRRSSSKAVRSWSRLCDDGISQRALFAPDLGDSRVAQRLSVGLERSSDRVASRLRLRHLIACRGEAGIHQASGTEMVRPSDSSAVSVSSLTVRPVAPGTSSSTIEVAIPPPQEHGLVVLDDRLDAGTSALPGICPSCGTRPRLTSGGAYFSTSSRPSTSISRPSTSSASHPCRRSGPWLSLGSSTRAGVQRGSPGSRRSSLTPTRSASLVVWSWWRRGRQPTMHSHRSGRRRTRRCGDRRRRSSISAARATSPAWMASISSWGQK